MPLETAFFGVGIIGDRRLTIGALFWRDGTYATGGLPVSLRVYGLHQLDMLKLLSFQGYVFSPSTDMTKILVYHGDNNALADGPLVELPDGTDIAPLQLLTTWEAWGS